MSFTVTVLGSSGSYASVDNACSGYLLRSPGANVLLDCGPGTVGPLQAAIDLAQIDAIVLTHCHPDHWLELPVLRNVFSYFVLTDAVPVYGTAETKSMYDTLTVAGRDDAMRWTTINPDSELVIGDQAWSFTRSDHPVETLGPRVVVDGSCSCSPPTAPRAGCSKMTARVSIWRSWTPATWQIWREEAFPT